MEEINEPDYEYEYEMALVRKMHRRQRIEWEELEADRDYSERNEDEY